MPKPMKRRDQCSCGKHRTAVPRHIEVSAFVVGKIDQQIACKEKGWLQ